MSFAKDNIYDTPQAVADFRFDERVVAVFPDMIHRSIPAYGALLQLLGVIGARYVKENSLIYDLGCALGGASFALHTFMPPTARIVAVDLSSAMISRFQQYLNDAAITNIETQVADVVDVELAPCDVVILNFTLQFIPPTQRLPLLRRIYAALNPGGVLLLSQKVRPDNDNVRAWHEAFKAAQGYSEMAIAQKRESLEAVMPTNSLAEEEARLKAAGFNEVEHYFKALSFNAWLGRKC